MNLKLEKKASPINLGTKRTCPECGTKFYDFDKQEIVCPKCHQQIDAISAVKPSTSVRSASKPKEINSGVLVEDKAELDDEEMEDFESIEEIEDLEELDAEADDTDDDEVVEELEGVDEEELEEDED